MKYLLFSVFILCTSYSSVWPRCSRQLSIVPIDFNESPSINRRIEVDSNASVLIDRRIFADVRKEPFTASNLSVSRRCELIHRGCRYHCNPFFPPPFLSCSVSVNRRVDLEWKRSATGWSWKREDDHGRYWIVQRDLISASKRRNRINCALYEDLAPFAGNRKFPFDVQLGNRM